MKEILLSKGQKALVDDADFERFGGLKWYAKANRKSFYAYRSQIINGKHVRFALHRVILDAPPDMVVDHVNGNTLDNRRENLRLAHYYQNSQNQRTRAIYRSSEFKGVSKFRTKWAAQIALRGVCVKLGNFSTAMDAARAYDNAAQLLFGEFAHLNFGGSNTLRRAREVLLTSERRPLAPTDIECPASELEPVGN